MKLDTSPLSPHMGVRISNLDLTKSMDEEIFAALRKIWLDANGVLVISRQNLTFEHQIAFSRRFGPLKPSIHKKGNAHPELVVLSNRASEKRLSKISGVFWHSDSSFDPVPVSATLLYGVEIPPAGGDTMFANQYLAYETLSPKMKVLLTGLMAANEYFNPATYSDRPQAESPSARPPAIHPIVRRHPETGRDALFITQGFTSKILGLPVDEGEAVLQFLFKHSTRPEFIYRHQWQQGDLMIWDNRCLQHYAVNDYDGIYTRHLHRGLD